MAGDHRTYFEERAEAQLALAQAATDARAVQAHYELATAYLDRVHADEPLTVASAAAEGAGVPA